MVPDYQTFAFFFKKSFFVVFDNGLIRSLLLTPYALLLYFCYVLVPVPRFTQKPLSYLTLPQLTEEPLNFTIEMVLIPEIADGLILYNDQRSNGSVGDFISFGMSDGFAEFRYSFVCYEILTN